MKTSKSKSETAAWIETPTACYLVGETKTDIISRMEANQARFHSLLQSAEDERRQERNRDLEYESLMADESEHGQRCNLPDEEAWRDLKAQVEK